MATQVVSLSPIGLKLHSEDNYEHWSVQIKTYLKAQDLWDIIDTEPSDSEDDEAAFKAWSKKDIIEAPTEPSESEDDEAASKAGSKKEIIEAPTEPSESEDDEAASKAGSKDIIEAPTEPSESEDDEAAFKAWSKKNAMALFAIQISCEPDIFDEIIEITSAKTAWDTLEKKFDPDIDSGTKKVYLQYEALHKAVMSGNWNDAKVFLDQHPHAVTARITEEDDTALHIAVDSGHEHIVEKLVELLSEQDLQMKECHGATALHVACTRGRSEQMAKCMLSKNEHLVSIPHNKSELLPVVRAIFFGQIDLARYLYSRTPLEDLQPDKGISGATLTTMSICTGNFDIALDLLRRCPALALAPDNRAGSPLYALSYRTSAFPSGYRLAFWKQWIYSCNHTQSARGTNEIRMDIQNLENQQNVQNIRSGINQIDEMKSIHESRELLCLMCEQISISNTVQQRKTGCVYDAIFRAIEEGNFEFVYEVVRKNPDLRWSRDEDNRTIFMVAVKYRQAKIFSLIYGLDEKNALTNGLDKFDNTILHMAGMLTASTKESRIPGAALQMQRELQWFKEVESIVHPNIKDGLNRDGLTAQELFTRDHEDMRKEGEKWMKETANSCTVVGALIVTIMFAAAFTVPGGNNQNTGFPMFLQQQGKLFMVFIVSDALSLFSSSASVLMFLGIFTSSSYFEQAFLKSLPTKMMIGLSTLFFSIVTMMIAFSAGLLLLLREQSWIIIPVICLAGVPVALLLQKATFIVVVEMFISTYRPSIFDRKMKCWFDLNP